MRELIWKEYREKRLWAVPVVGSVVLVTALTKNFWFIGNIYTNYGFLPWTAAACIATLLMGLSSFSWEIGGGAVDFVMSKPITWKRLLGAKLTVGLGMILFAALAGAITYRIVCPELYIKFATSAALAQGSLITFAVLAAPYILGMSASVILPGIIGSVIVLAINMLLAGGVAFIIQKATTDPAVKHNYEYVDPNMWSVAFPWAWLIAMPVAMLLTVRFGLTLRPLARALRYAAALAAAMVVAVPALYYPANTFITNLVIRPESSCWISPYGDYALYSRVVLRTKNPYQSLDLVRITDGARANLKDYLFTITWTPDNKVIVLDNRDKDKAPVFPGRYFLRSYRIDSSGRLQTTTILEDQNWPSAIASPGRDKLLLMRYRRLMPKDKRILSSISFYDVVNMKPIGPTVPINRIKNFTAGWIDNDTAAYRLDGKTMYIEVE